MKNNNNKIYDYNESVFGNDLPHPRSFVILRPKTATKNCETIVMRRVQL